MTKIERLLAYQEEDAKLNEIERKLGESEARKKGLEAQRFLKSVGETLSGMEAKAQELCANYDNCEKELEALKEDNAEFDLIAQKVEDNKEISYLKTKASELGRELNELYGKVMKIKQEMRDLAVVYGKLRKETGAYQEQYKSSGEEYGKLKNSLEPERKQIEEKLAGLEKDVLPELMKKYKEKRKDKHFPIVYQVDGKHCAYCQTELSLLQLDKLKEDGTVIECENCRRLIFK